MSKALPAREAVIGAGVAADATTPGGHHAPGATWRRLRMAGWSDEEASNLVAHLAGLQIGRTPWTLAEIERLEFTRSMTASGRLKS